MIKYVAVIAIWVCAAGALVGMAFADGDVAALAAFPLIIATVVGTIAVAHSKVAS